MRSRRAILYVPGSDLRKIEKAPNLGADSVCLDLEDGVALNRKADARTAVAHALRTLDFGPSEKLVRINAIGSGLELDDLADVLLARPDGIVIPKVADADQVRWVSRQVAAVERAQGWAPDTICLLALIESARGLLNVAQIAASDPRLQALLFGAEDYSGNIGATRTREGLEVLYARSAVVAAASAYALQAIDMLFLDFHDIDGLVNEVRRGAILGYSGTQVIHPNQIGPAQTVYTPDDEAIELAQRLVAAHSTHQAMGTGAFAVDNKMVDMAIIRTAERVLARARAAGKIS